MKNLMSTFSSNFGTFYRNFVDAGRAFNKFILQERDEVDASERYGCRKSALVAVSKFYKSRALTRELKRRSNHDAIIIYGTWDDEAEHSWWDYVHEMFSSSLRNTFRDSMHWQLHGTDATQAEFGLVSYSLDTKHDLSVWRVVQELLDVVSLDKENLEEPVSFDSYAYTRSILSLRGQSILEASWDFEPRLLSGLTAAKYLPNNTGMIACFSFAALITLAELLRGMGRSEVELYTKGPNPKIADHFRDLIEIGDNLLGGKW